MDTLSLSTVGSLLLKLKNDDSLWEKVMERVITNHTEAFIKAASEVGLCESWVDVPSHLGLNIAAIPQSIFNEIGRACAPVGNNKYSKKVEGIKEARARLGIGLKEAKDLVEHFFEFDTSRFQY